MLSVSGDCALPVAKMSAVNFWLCSVRLPCRDVWVCLSGDMNVHTQTLIHSGLGAPRSCRAEKIGHHPTAVQAAAAVFKRFKNTRRNAWCMTLTSLVGPVGRSSGISWLGCSQVLDSSNDSGLAARLQGQPFADYRLLQAWHFKLVSLYGRFKVSIKEPTPSP